MADMQHISRDTEILWTIDMHRQADELARAGKNEGADRLRDAIISRHIEMLRAAIGTIVRAEYDSQFNIMPSMQVYSDGGVLLDPGAYAEDGGRLSFHQGELVIHAGPVIGVMMRVEEPIPGTHGIPLYGSASLRHVVQVETGKTLYFHPKVTKGFSGRIREGSQDEKLTRRREFFGTMVDRWDTYLAQMGEDLKRHSQNLKKSEEIEDAEEDYRAT